MKTPLFIAVAALLLFVSPLKAQWSIGGAVDIHVASISVDSDFTGEEYSSRVAFGLGIVADRPLTNGIDLHAEPMFLQKGGVIKEDGDEITLKTSYLEIPVFLKYGFSSGGSYEPYVIIGPNLGFMMNGKFTDGEFEQDAKDELKSLDLGVGFGGGVSVPKGDKTFFGEARYVLGLTDINEDSDEASVKNRGLQLVFGITVPIGQ